MYPEIKKDLESGEILLEWDNSKGKAPKPLLKDKYANERKKAKIMNFSIAYGKTVHGFMKDWNCSKEEAQATVELWYSDRPEVKEWQKMIQSKAITRGWTQTLLGRYRNLTKHFIMSSTNQIHQFQLLSVHKFPMKCRLLYFQKMQEKKYLLVLLKQIQFFNIHLFSQSQILKTKGQILFRFEIIY